MIKIILNIEGMQCGMCESHVNGVIRDTFSVKKVNSSHTKNQTIIITENDINEDLLKKAIAKTGYEVISVEKEPYEKKGLFAAFRK